MLEPLLVTFGLIFLSVFLLYKYLTWHFDVWNEVGLPGPKPSIVFGNFPSAITQKQPLIYDFDEVYRQYKNKHHAIGVFMTRHPEILLLDPKLAHKVMVTDFRKYRNNVSSKWIVNRSTDKYAARNPFFDGSDEWKTRRTDALAGMTNSKLNLAYPIWKATAGKLRTYLKEHRASASANAIMETKDLAYRFTVNVLADFLWGINANTFASGNAPNTIMDMAMKRLLQTNYASLLYYKLHLVPFVKRFFNYRLFPELTDNFFSQLTKDAREMRVKDAQIADRVDYLNYLIQLEQKKQLSHDDFVGHVMIAMLDGYDTAAEVASHTLFYLSKYPEVQEKLRKEILAQSFGSDGFLTFADLTSLPYLDQCIHETIRMVSPIPIFARICTEPTELEIDGRKTIPIKLGTVLTIPIFSYHHDPDYFPQPYAYKPERFDNGGDAEMTKQGIYMGFGVGPRICLGMRMGLFEVKTMIVEILREYRVKSCAKTIAEKKPDAKSFFSGLNGEFWLEYEHLNNVTTNQMK